MERFRAVIRNAKTNETELILTESKNFCSCLKSARAAIKGGVSAAQVDILRKNQVELWASVWSERVRNHD